jgi:hypothetical protein
MQKICKVKLEGQANILIIYRHAMVEENVNGCTLTAVETGNCG